MPTLVKGTDFVCSASICYSKNYKQKDAIDALFKELQHQINEFAQVVNSRTPFSGFVPLKLDGFIGAGTVALLTKAVMALPINTMRFGAMPGETWAGTSKEGLAGSADKWVVDLKNAIIQMTTPGGPPVPPPSPGTTAQQQADATVAEAQRVAAANELAKRQAATDAQIAALQAGLTVAQQKAAADAAVAAESARQQAAAAAAGQQQPGQKPTGQPGASNTLWWALGGGAILVLVVGGFFAAKATRRPDPAPSIAGGYGMWTPRPEPKHACPAGEFWTRGRCKRILWR
jgi:hypothetical protein